MTDFYPTLRKDLIRELTWDELDGNFEKIKTGLDKSVKIAGYFSAGFVYNSYNEIGVTPDGQWWSYNGVLPFTVAAGTVPSAPTYTQRGDAALRSALAAPDSTVPIGGVPASRLSKTVIQTTHLKALPTTGLVDNQQYSVAGFYAGSTVGGGMFVYDANKSKVEHDGAMIIAPEAINSWDGTPANLINLFDWTGAGNGCFVKQNAGFISLDEFGSVADYNYETQTGTDNSVSFKAAFAYMNKQKRKLISSGGDYYCTTPPKVSGWVDVDIKAATVILSDTDSWGMEFENTHSQIGTWSTPGTDTGLGLLMQFITVNNHDDYIRGETVMVQDPNAVYDVNQSNAKRAEIFQVADKIGNKIYLNDFFCDAMTSGNVYRLPENTCNIRMTVRGKNPIAPNPARRAAITVIGYVNPQVDCYVHHDASRGLLPISCYGGDYKVVGFALADNASIGHYGYAASPYGACKGGNYTIIADKCRHAYTDGIYPILNRYITDGCVIGSKVTGVAISCTSAAWDTHPFSDRTLFNDCHTLGTHQDALQNNTGTNYAYQLRGTNQTIQGGTATVERLLTYIVAANRIRKSTDVIDNVKHEYGKENLNFDIEVWGASEFSQINGYNQPHTLTIKNIRLKKTNHRVAGIGFVYHENCVIDAGDRAAFQSEAVGAVDTIQRYKSCRFVSAGNYRFFTSIVYLDDCTIDKASGVAGGTTWAIRGSNTTVYANNVGYIGDTINGSSIWEFGIQGQPLGIQPTNCKLYHSNNWGVRRTGAMPLALVQNYADERNASYLDVIDMRATPLVYSAFAMPLVSLRGTRIFATELGFSPEWSGTFWGVQGRRCIGPTANRPSAPLWSGFRYADTTTSAVVTWDGSAWV